MGTEPAMDWAEILERISSGENERTEFKRELGNLSAIGKVLCSFANGVGGLLILGVDDNGQILGVKEDPEKVQERMTSFLHTCCGQPIIANVNRHLSPDGWVHWIEVKNQGRGFKPFSYKHQFWIRRGRSTVAPSESEFRGLLNVFGVVFTEQQIIPSSNPGDIDLDAYRSFMRSQGKLMDETPQLNIEVDLKNSSICDWLDDELRATLYGLMVFGREPQKFPNMTSFFISCAAYAGADRAAQVLSAAESKGRLDEQVHRAMGWYQSLGRREVYQGLIRKDIPLLPEAVLREALVNAVIHRDYSVFGSRVLLEVFSDRIDVTSPGSLPNHMTAQQVRFGGAPRSRNEMMSNAMVVRKLMDRRGRGWLLMRHEMRTFNGSEPELINDQENRYVRVTFRLSSKDAITEP